MKLNRSLFSAFALVAGLGLAAAPVTAQDTRANDVEYETEDEGGMDLGWLGLLGLLGLLGMRKKHDHDHTRHTTTHTHTPGTGGTTGTTRI